jgi:subtilase family serine protease
VPRGPGGTSLSSPLWSGIAADRDSFQGFNGAHLENNNGFFPATNGYDLSTGIGVPRMGAIITRSF